MLTISGRSAGRFCDGVTRRSMLRIGSLGFCGVGFGGVGAGGLTLADLLRSEAVASTAGAATPAPKAKSIINVILPGGISHIDSFDMKPDAPSEIRGEFKPIRTNVPGIEICEYLPQLAQHADKFSIVRSMHGFFNEHNNRQADSGWAASAGRPGIGAVVSKVIGPSERCTVPAVALQKGLTSPGFLGPQWTDFEPFGSAGVHDARSSVAESMRLAMSRERFESRAALLDRLEAVRRTVESSGDYAASDVFTRKASDLVLSGRMADAIDLTKESAESRAVYGVDRPYSGLAPFLMARRLVEAGVRVVSLAFGGWDTHNDNFPHMKQNLPLLDKALSVFLADLHDRGMLDETLVIVTTEFGRTPRIGVDGPVKPGRSHWPSAGTFLIAGGGTRMGQVVGSTNRLGEMPENDPVHLQEFFATVYRQLGIDVNSVMLHDTTGRPHYLVDHRRVIEQLI